MDLSIVEEQLKKVPEEIKKVFFSTETAEKIAAIGDRNGLLLDQINDLIEETGLTMIGLRPSKQFVENIGKKVAIDHAVAQKIAEEINSEVLAGIRERAQEIDEGPKGPAGKTESSAISDIEQAGGFTVEHDQKTPETNGVTSADRAAILEGVENPVPAKQTTGGAVEETYTEPLIDHLLGNAVGITELKVEQKQPAPAPTNLPTGDMGIRAAPVKREMDPYKEPIS